MNTLGVASGYVLVRKASGLFMTLINKEKMTAGRLGYHDVARGYAEHERLVPYSFTGLHLLLFGFGWNCVLFFFFLFNCFNNQENDKQDK